MAMQISSHLPQFEKTKALLVVTSLHEVRLLEVQSGEIVELVREEVEKPEPAKKEGHFESRIGGKTIRSGSVYEHDDGETIRRLSFLLKEVLPIKFKEGDYDEVYIFTPDQMKGEIDNILPKNILAKVVFRREGNFVKEKPFVFLEMIAKTQLDKKVIPTGTEADKILKRPR